MTVQKNGLPFKEVKQAALGCIRDLVAEWFPNGQLVDGKREWAVGNIHGDPGGPDGGSFKINLKTGAWQEMNGGEPAGRDLVSLYAHKFCGADMGKACRELAATLGIDAAAPAKDNVVRLATKEEKEWQPQVPPPDDALPRAPYTDDWDHVYVYRDQAGKVLRYVVRNDAKYAGDTLKDAKLVRPITYGTLRGVTKWHRKAPNNPRCLYGLERLDGRKVLLQEGEHKTDAVQMRLPTLACLSLTGGTGGKNCNDLEPLRGLPVIVCGDADDGGQKAAEDIARQLLAIGCAVTLVDMAGMPPGWDLGNACSGSMRDKETGKFIWHEPPWNGEKIESFLEERGRKFPADEEPEPEHGPEFDDGFDGGAADERRQYGGADYRHLAPIALGYDGDVYYYLSQMTGQIVALARSRHTQAELIGIAPLQYFESLEEFRTQEGGVSWMRVANDLKIKCTQRDIFNPDIVRGRGAWIDAGRAVMNVGNRLIVDGQTHPLHLPDSDYVYEKARPLNYVVAEPLSKERAGELLELCTLFRWGKPIYGTLMAGWLAVAPICGALFWRPAIWLTGGSGSGKSTLEKLIIEPALGGIGLFVKGGTTEAGIRQKSKRDARPLWFDEAESENPKAKGIMQGILDLNRQSSSEGGAEIIKGTQSQTGAMTYRVKACFGFSSINPMLEHLADESRITMLELNSVDAEARAGFDAFVDRISKTMTPEFCAGFVARSVWLMPVILENARTFSKAVAVHLGSARVGDQIGTLLAGAFSEKSDKRVSFDAALKWVREQDWDGTTSADATPDEQRMLNRLMQRRTKADIAGAIMDITLDELVRIASDPMESEPPRASADRELRRHGIAWDEERQGVWISNTHTALKEHFKDTAWSSQWAHALRRLPGTMPLGRDEPAIRFAGELARATFVPRSLI